MHLNITEHPTAQWTAHQISEAFLWEAAPRYLVRDRDRVYGPAFTDRVECMGIEEILTAPRSLWQNPIHRAGHRQHPPRVPRSRRRPQRAVPAPLLADYFQHYYRWRCHRSLAMDSPFPRPVQRAEFGRVAEVAEAGGLYRHYERRAA